MDHQSGAMAVIHVAHRDRRTVVQITGEIDQASAPRLEATLGLLDGPLVIDCSELRFIDAAGLSVLVKASREHDGVKLRNVSPYLQELIAAAKLSHALRVDRSHPM